MHWWHKWSKWKIMEKGQIYTYDRRNNEQHITGVFITQQRECEKCGKIELCEQRAEL